jgi:hypothetical protein
MKTKWFFPFVSSFALPPDFRLGSGNNSFWGNVTVFVRMPFHRDHGKPRCQIVVIANFPVRTVGASMTINTSDHRCLPFMSFLAFPPELSVTSRSGLTTSDLARRRKHWTGEFEWPLWVISCLSSSYQPNGCFRDWWFVRNVRFRR